MKSDYVIEIGVWDEQDGSLALVQHAVDSDDLGVVITGTVGTRWENPYLETITAACMNADLLAGWMHVCEPHRNSPEVEAKFLLERASMYQLGLGVWIEFYDSVGLRGYELTQWVETFTKLVTAFEPDVVVRAPGYIIDELGYTLDSLRVIPVGPVGDGQVRAWATALDMDEGGPGNNPYTCYKIHNTRGIIPFYGTIITDGPEDDTPEDTPEDEPTEVQPSAPVSPLDRLLAVVDSESDEGSEDDGDAA